MTDALPAEPSRTRREVYIDAFRGVMALVMVQGHVYERLLEPLARADPLYQFQFVLHGSTAPGFLFASGFVAGLPRAPLSARASLRRARRLAFILAIGYILHLPYFSIWKIVNEATPAQRAALFACDALQVIALTQLAVIGLQWLAGRHWTTVAGVATLMILAAGPGIWASQASSHLPPVLGAYLDRGSGSTFPIFPFSAFVLAGTVAGAGIGRQDPVRRRRRALGWGLGLVLGGLVLALASRGWVDFWRGASPAYTLLRLGGLVLLLRLVEAAADRRLLGIPTLALLGHETLHVYILHLYFLHGGIISAAPLGALRERLGFGETTVVLVLMVPVLLTTAWAWHWLKTRAGREARLCLVLLSVYFCWQFLTRPW